MDLDEGSSQRERSISYIPERSYHSEWDQEIEYLWKQVKELELELEIRGQRQRRDQEGSSNDPDFTGERLPIEVIHGDQGTDLTRL